MHQLRSSHVDCSLVVAPTVLITSVAALRASAQPHAGALRGVGYVAVQAAKQMRIEPATLLQAADVLLRKPSMRVARGHPASA
jgi:hypothetical protein